MRAPVATLGIGVQQIVEIVRALRDDARVLVLDEPTAALTGDEAARLFAWLRELAARGTTCIYVSHRMDEVFALCDRITVLRDGSTVGTVDDRATSSGAGGGAHDDRPRGRRRATTPSAVSAHDAQTVLEVRHLCASKARSMTSRSTVRAGEVVALAGAMGSGRTALLVDAVRLRQHARDGRRPRRRRARRRSTRRAPPSPPASRSCPRIARGAASCSS